MYSVTQQIEENLLLRLPDEGVIIKGKLKSYQILSIADKCNFKSVIKQCSILITRQCKSYDPPSCEQYTPETKIIVYTDWIREKLNKMDLMAVNNLRFSQCIVNNTKVYYQSPSDYIQGIRKAVERLAIPPE